jgi:two-component system, OmpR family, sensor histidine kinase MtrB
MGRQRWWRGLRARVTLTYAIGSLLLSATVAIASFALARSQLLEAAELQHREQAYANVRDLRQNLDPLQLAGSDSTKRKETILQSMSELSGFNGSRQALRLADGQWISRFQLATPLETTPLVSATNKFQVADMVIDVDGEISYAVGIQIDSISASYYEVRSLKDLEQTLNSLRVILVGVAALASLAGATLGYYSAGRALSPLSRISSAASAIAAGDFSTKLDLQDDRDLALLGNAFNDMVDAVGQRIARERQFTSDVSHELRSPLMTLAASVEILERRRDSLPDVAQQAIDLLSLDLERFQRLVEDLLEISRMEAGAVQLQLSEFKLIEFLENVMAQSRSPHLLMSFSPGDPDLIINADKRRLAQVMVNLIDNAEKYGDGASGISYEVIGDEVQIVVEDNGPGVPVEARDRIFERFARMGGVAGNRSAASGFGLGLSLVAEHIRLHGGSCWVTDRIDGQHGSRFVVKLPVGHDVQHHEELAL